MILEALNLSVILNGKKILKNITVSFRGPGVYYILGPNGSGKSTLLKALANLIEFKGSILLNGQDIRKIKRSDLARKIGYVWQNPLYGFFEASVEREIAFILKNLNIPREKMSEIVKFFEIEDFLRRSPFTLSGGEAKRVSIASVIVADQQIILLDEPEAEMDLRGLDCLIEYIRRNKHKKLIIVASHNTIFAYKLRKVLRKIIIINDGRIVRVGNAELLTDRDLLREVGVMPLDWWEE